jgi:RNA polymerase sigma-70 factor (ECF subfamily)
MPDAALFEAERPRLVRLAYRMTGSLAEAEDLVQDAWLR